MNFSLYDDKSFHSKYNEYLLTCDLINKYCLKNVYKKPKIGEIRLLYSWKDENSKNFDVPNDEIQTRILLFFTIAFSLYPRIVLNTINTNCKRNPSKTLRCSFEIKIFNIEEINQILIYLLILHNNHIECRFKKNCSKKNLKQFFQFVLIVFDIFFELEKEIFFSKFNHIEKSRISFGLLIENSFFSQQLKTIKNMSFCWLL